MKLLWLLTGGRPMTRLSYAFTDRVARQEVWRWRDRLGRYWLAHHAWARFRVATVDPPRAEP